MSDYSTPWAAVCTILGNYTRSAYEAAYTAPEFRMDWKPPTPKPVPCTLGVHVKTKDEPSAHSVKPKAIKPAIFYNGLSNKRSHVAEDFPSKNSESKKAKSPNRKKKSLREAKRSRDRYLRYLLRLAILNKKQRLKLVLSSSGTNHIKLRKALRMAKLIRKLYSALTHKRKQRINKALSRNDGLGGYFCE